MGETTMVRYSRIESW